MLARAEMMAIIAAGQGIVLEGRIITRVEDLPAELPDQVDVLRDEQGNPLEVPPGDLAAELAAPESLPKPAAKKAGK